MIVRNRKTLKEYQLDKAGWDKLVEKKINRNFIIVDATDVPIKGKILIPKEIVEFQSTLPKNLKITKTPEKPKQ